MAAGATYEPIATTTLGSAQGTITFSSIPATYTDLRVVLVGTSTNTGSADAWYITFNGGISGTLYSDTRLYGTGASAVSANNTGNSYITLGGASTGQSSTLPAMATADIFSYAGSTNKTCLITESMDKNGSGEVLCGVGLWRSTAAITSIVLSCNYTFATGTTATLYGIKAA